METQIIPINRFGGVGVVFNRRICSFLVYLMEGRKYRVEKAKGVVGLGKALFCEVK